MERRAILEGVEALVDVGQPRLGLRHRLRLDAHRLVRHAALEVRGVVGGELEADSQVLHVRQGHVQLRVHLAEAGDGVVALVRREDGHSLLLLLRRHAVPEGWEQRVHDCNSHQAPQRPSQARGERARPGRAQRGSGRSAPIVERDAVVGVEVDHLERLDPRLGPELPDARQADVHELPAVDDGLGEGRGRAQESEGRAHVALVLERDLLCEGTHAQEEGRDE
eukprot:3849151-Prymnesium_polylepis.1